MAASSGHLPGHPGCYCAACRHKREAAAVVAKCERVQEHLHDHRLEVQSGEPRKDDRL